MVHEEPLTSTERFHSTNVLYSGKWSFRLLLLFGSLKGYLESSTWFFYAIAPKKHFIFKSVTPTAFRLAIMECDTTQ